jgi:threonine synthase
MAALREEGGFAVGQGAIETLRDWFASGRASEEDTAAAIAGTLQATGELVCPHTAVGLHVAEAFLGDTPMVTLATAHPAKFPDAVEAATGIRPPLPPRMADLYDRPERVTRVPNDLAALKSLIRERIRA